MAQIICLHGKELSENQIFIKIRARKTAVYQAIKKFQINSNLRFLYEREEKCNTPSIVPSLALLSHLSPLLTSSPRESASVFAFF